MKLGRPDGPSATKTDRGHASEDPHADGDAPSTRMMAEIEPGFRSLLYDAATHWNASNSRIVASNTTGAMHDGDLED